MRIEIEIKGEQLFFKTEIGTDKEQGSFALNQRNYFLLAELAHIFNQYRAEQIEEYKDRAIWEKLKEITSEGGEL